jgi:hypothetical protein
MKKVESGRVQRQADSLINDAADAAGSLLNQTSAAVADPSASAGH